MRTAHEAQTTSDRFAWAWRLDVTAGRGDLPSARSAGPFGRCVREKSVHVRLPVEPVDTVYAACRHTAKDAITLRKEWKHGFGPSFSTTFLAAEWAAAPLPSRRSGR
ncbi:hypothetical protein GCM10018772_23970 [Streptomyces fumanus]|uniref:Uncharacterized protein n=1 Tax=Streptomyces fumanus TaxID=67302 RepID=A0A919E0V9_9ACTN|nr:hypothetical protein GCM10018772_23970 [Streptomyces fumanus]